VHAFRLSACDAMLRYLDLPGGGRPLVCLHGLGCAATSDFPAVVADAHLADRRRILVDFVGSGFSDRPESFPYDVDSHAACVVELVEALGLDAVDLFGHSMGGTVALVAATRRPGLVGALVLGEPNLDPGGGAFSRQIAAWSEADYVSGGHRALEREARLSGNDNGAGTLAVSSPLAVHRGAVSLVAGSSPTWRQRLVSLPMPRTVLVGERSLPDPDVTRLSDQGVRVAIVPGAGHSMMWENPAGLAEAIAGALAPPGTPALVGEAAQARPSANNHDRARVSTRVERG
jgi:pimeloyl-ACP methyl ester carboxylesterase